jgi:hypothetical protein
MNHISETTKKEEGVSLIITFFIMIIILAVVIMTSTLLYSGIRILRNVSNSIVAYYVSESGLEKVFYYDRKVLPSGASRGLCSMFNSVNNPDYCQQDPGGQSQHSIYCNSPLMTVIDAAHNPNGCSPAICNSCQIEFETTISGNDKYKVKANVTLNGEKTNFYISSTGNKENTSRAIEVSSQQ